jgi:hypothetical protein
LTGPPPKGPSPPNGTLVPMDLPYLLPAVPPLIQATSCAVETWFLPYVSNGQYRIPVYEVTGGQAQVSGCVTVGITVSAGLALVQAQLQAQSTPETLQPCGAQQLQ